PGQLRSVDAEGTIILWAARTSTITRQARLSGARRPHVSHDLGLYDITFSPDGRYALGRVTNDGMRDGTRRWDSRTGQVVCDLRGVPGRQGIGSPVGGKPVVVTSEGVGPNAVLSVWEVPTGRLVRTLQGFGDSSSTVLSPDGK